MLNRVEPLNNDPHIVLSKKIKREVIDAMKYQNAICFIFGVQKVHIISDKIVPVGKYYKLYSIFIFLILTTGMFWSVVINVKRNSNNSLSVLLTTITSYASMIVAYMVTAINCFMFSPEITKEIFNSFLKVDQNFLLLQNSRKNNVKTMVVLLHSFYIVLKSFLTLVDLIDWMTLDTIIGHICTSVIDLEILHFIINVEVTARAFELLNRRLAKLSLPKSIDFDIKDGLMAKIWKRDISVINNNLSEKSIKKCIAVYNQLAEIIDSINFSFGLTVKLNKNSLLFILKRFNSLEFIFFSYCFHRYQHFVLFWLLYI